MRGETQSKNTRLAVVEMLTYVPRMKYHSALAAASRHQHSVWGITGPHQAAAGDKQRNMFYSVTARIIKFYPPSVSSNVAIVDFPSRVLALSG